MSSGGKASGGKAGGKVGGEADKKSSSRSAKAGLQVRRALCCRLLAQARAPLADLAPLTSLSSCPQFPVGRIHRLLKKGNYAQRVGAGAPVYLAAVLECASPPACPRRVASSLIADLPSRPSTLQTSRPRSSSSPVTPLVTTRSRASFPGTFSSPSATTRSSTSSSATSSSRRVVSCPRSSPSSCPPSRASRRLPSRRTSRQTPGLAFLPFPFSPRLRSLPSRLS